MSPLFGKSEEKATREETGRIEFGRLSALPVADLAVEIMPAFGPDGPRGRGPDVGINFLQLLSWLNHTHFPPGISYVRQLDQLVREGVHALDHAGLVMTPRHSGSQWVAATRLGRTALAEGTVSSYLNGPPNP